MIDRVRRVELLVAAVALAAGALALLFARDLAFTSAQGARVGSLFSLNPLGALLTIALAVLALAAAASRAHRLVQAAGAGFLVAAAVQLAQSGRATNWLGGRPSTFSLLLAVAAGLIVLGGAQSAYVRSGGERP